MSQPGEHQFQFLDVTSSVSPVDMQPHGVVASSAHYYASLPQPPPQPVYLILDQTAGVVYPSASVAAGSVLSTSGYMAPIPPMMAAPIQSAGMMLPPGVIPAAAPPTRNIIPPTMLRPGIMQQPRAPGVIVQSGLVPPPPTGILPPHGTVLPMPHSVPQMPVLPLNAGSPLALGYAGQPLLAGGANGLDSQPVNSMPVDGAKSAEHDGIYVADGCNLNNSAIEQSQSVVATDTECSPSAKFIDSVDVDVSEHGDSLPTYAQCSDASVLTASVDNCAAAVASVNGELSVDASSHEVCSSSESSSVTSPSSVLADMTLTDNTDGSNSHTISSSSSLDTAASSSAARTKAPSWASLLKDTTSATNAIVISMNDGHSVASQQKTDAKSLVKEPVTSQSVTSHVSNDEKLKHEVSGLFVLLQMSNVYNCSGCDCDLMSDNRHIGGNVPSITRQC